MRYGRIKNRICAGIKPILMLVLLLCLAAPTATAQNEAQRYRKIVSDLKKRGNTRADVERDYKSLKSSNRFGNGKLELAARDAELKHYEKILKYWPAEGGSGAGQGASGGSRGAMDEGKVSNVLQELARSSNEKVITRSAASPIGEMIDNARGEMDHEIPANPNGSNLKNQTNMDASELLGMVEGSNGVGNPRARQSETDRDSAGSRNNLLTDDFMGAKSVSADSFVNDIPVSEYEKAVEYWAREMEKYPKGSSDNDWARANYEDAVMRLKAKKAAVQRTEVEKDLGNSESSYKAGPQSKKNAPQSKTPDGREREGNSKAYGNVKVNGLGISMPKKSREK